MSRILTTGAFYRQIKQLNPRLRVCSFDGNDKLAGLYILGHDGEEYFDICGVDKGYVPEYTEWDRAGHIVKSGWRRVFFILLKLRLTTVQKVRRVCPGFFTHWSQVEVDADRDVQTGGDPIAQKLGVLAYKEALTSDDILEVATDIRGKDSDAQKAETEQERWFLETWAKRGGNLTDKPKV